MKFVYKLDYTASSYGIQGLDSLLAKIITVILCIYKQNVMLEIKTTLKIFPTLKEHRLMI